MELINKSDVINITAETGALETQSRVREMPAIMNIPNNATNGDVIKALFPNVKSKHGLVFVNFSLDKVVGSTVTKEWWSTPYKAGDTDAL